jgi:Tol biopolymer transport system component
MAFLDSQDANTPDNRQTIMPGPNGVSWSPDGEWLAYQLYYGFLDRGGAFDFLAKSRVDGTGDIQVLVPGHGNSVFQSPTWSPNGRTVVFTDISGRIRSVSSEGGPVTNLVSGDGDCAPAWYH